MKSLSEIEALLRQSKPDLIQRYPIRSLAIFGSYARNEQSAASDLDVVVDVDGRIGSRFIDLTEEIEQIIGMRVDLVSKNGIKEKYLKAIQSELIYV